MQYIFIFNGLPSKKGTLDAVSERMEAEDFQCTKYVTTDSGDAARYVNIFCDINSSEEVCFVVCGGHGLVNEVASSLVGKPGKSLAILPSVRDLSSIREFLLRDAVPTDIIKVNDNYALDTVEIWAEGGFLGIHDITLHVDEGQKTCRYLSCAKVFSHGERLSLDAKALFTRIQLTASCLEFTSPDLMIVSLDGEIVAAGGVRITVEKGALNIIRA